jgi:hypothetical protein
MNKEKFALAFAESAWQSKFTETTGRNVTEYTCRRKYM